MPVSQVAGITDVHNHVWLNNGFKANLREMHTLPRGLSLKTVCPCVDVAGVLKMSCVGIISELARIANSETPASV
jgi:hypothetical protein